MKLKKLEVTYDSGDPYRDNILKKTRTYQNVKFTLTKAIIKEMWDTANATEREMLTQVVVDNKETGKDAELYKNAEIVIQQYNRITSKNIKARHANGSKTSSLVLIYRILKKGYTLQDCLIVLDLKSRQKWFFQNDWHFFTIKTLFRPSNFEKYIQEVKR